jgi:hypothetical protein
MISYTASMSLLVPRGGVKRCVDAILSLMSSYGGYISSLSVWEDKAVLAVKVPQSSMMAFMEDVSRMGRVAGKSISGTDLADRIIDLEARLRGAREAEARLLELLDRARSVDEALSIMREVSRVRGEMEAMEAQLRNLETSISYAAITIEVSEEPESRRVEVIFRVLDSRGLLETPENGVILIVADPSACRMTNITTVTRIVNITYTTMTLIGGRTTSVVTVCTAQKPKGECLWGMIIYIADSTTVIAASVSYTTETMTRVNDFVAQPAPITLTFTTRTAATITRTMIFGARSLDYWDPSASCYVWFRVMNATGGGRLAEAGVKVLAGPATITTQQPS